MTKTLVAYFSAEGTTAKEYADKVGADLFEITPETPYSAADINWKNPLSRCNKEFFSKKKVPVSGRIAAFASYEQVPVGFPIWYGSAPNVVKPSHWTGKKVIAFATSGGSPIDKTAEKLRPYVKGAGSLEAVLVKTAAELSDR